MRDSIDIAFCGSKPYATWCGSVTKLDGKYNLDVDGESFAIVTHYQDTPKGRKAAMSMCRDLAATTYDDNAQPIGVYYLTVYDITGKKALADCEVPYDH